MPLLIVLCLSLCVIFLVLSRPQRLLSGCRPAAPLLELPPATVAAVEVAVIAATSAAAAAASTSPAPIHPAAPRARIVASAASLSAVAVSGPQQGLRRTESCWGLHAGTSHSQRPNMPLSHP